MSSLICTVTESSNYIYHMLSVGHVGYDNEYGKKYMRYHSEQDLKILKNNELLLTVSGGEHCGALYVLLIGKAAATSNLVAMKYYLRAIKDLFCSNNCKTTAQKYSLIESNVIDPNFEGIAEMFEFCLTTFNGYSDQIIEIIEVLLRNTDSYLNEVWKSEKEELYKYKTELEKKIEEIGDIIKEWENRLGIEYQREKFEVLLCSSIENGPQAINISETKDVFSSTNPINVLIKWISHEIGIYIIFHRLPQFVRDDLMKYWDPIESLSTYHNSYILDPNKTHWEEDNQYLKHYHEMYESNPNISISEIIENTFI